MHKTTWIVIADGAKAHIYNWHGVNKTIELVKGGELNHANKPSQELISNETGAMYPGANARSALERRSDPHEQEREIFAHEISDFLNVRQKQIDRLVLIAAPKVLGNIRQVLPASVKDKIFAEVDKDLTNIPYQELPEHLQNIF